jgi:hypothetical protein
VARYALASLPLPAALRRETASYQSLGEAERGAPKAPPWSPFGAYTVPALVSFSDLISALASGARLAALDVRLGGTACAKCMHDSAQAAWPFRASLLLAVAQG